MVLEWKLIEICINDLILDQARQLGESGVSSDGKVGEWFVDIRGSKVVAPACVD
jgi:hypothetical protein